SPYWPAITLLVVLSYVSAGFAALLPVLMAPLLDLALGGSTAPAQGPITFDSLSLNNLGAAFFQWLHIDAVQDRFRAIAMLCAAYVAVGFLKGWADFGNYVLALWVRVRTCAAMQRDLFRHLLSLSMRFFTRQRGGELASRLNTDTAVAAAGLETIIC